ncbi:class II aldolase/adducin family protein [Deinococcus oregonensis]|uniref:Class II aldolase/adducin family protein n=1 Tax=Deinococcus oregonensis TaxID=1805970 RepID=A0ABV6AY67_9DEIO
MTDALRTHLAQAARELAARGLTTSTGGNLSHRLGSSQAHSQQLQGFLVSGTNTAFARQQPQDFAECDLHGGPVLGVVPISDDKTAAEHLGPRPSKEAAFHAAIYRTRPEVCAVLHLHATDSLTLSCLAAPTEEGNVLPVHSSYAVTRVGRVPLLPYLPPGGGALAQAVERNCRDVQALLLQNHGVITYGRSLEEAGDILEELEQNVRVWLRSQGQARVLDDAELLDANARATHGAAIAPGEQRPRLLAHVQGWTP